MEPVSLTVLIVVSSFTLAGTALTGIIGFVNCSKLRAQERKSSEHSDRTIEVEFDNTTTTSPEGEVVSKTTRTVRVKTCKQLEDIMRMVELERPDEAGEVENPFLEDHPAAQTAVNTGGALGRFLGGIFRSKRGEKQEKISIEMDDMSSVKMAGENKVKMHDIPTIEYSSEE